MAQIVLQEVKPAQNTYLEDLRIRIVKEMLDQFPKLRKWVKAYLTVYG